MNDRELLLSFIASLSLADHLGDVANDICDVLNKLKEKEILKEAESHIAFWPGLQKGLAKKGIKTICGTTLE